MKLKEKIRTEASGYHEKSVLKRLNPAAEILLSAFGGFLAAETTLGGNGAPLCTALIAVASFFNGFAAFAGAISSFFLYRNISSHITEIIAMPAVIISRATLTFLFRKRITPATSAILAAASYIFCGIITAVTYGISAVLVLAIIFRGFICGITAYFAAKVISNTSPKTSNSADNTVSLAVIYAVLICMLCTMDFGSFNAGRIFGAFVTIAAAYKYGIAGGGTVSAVSAFSFGASLSSMSSSAAIFICSGISSGIFSKKSKFVSCTAFLGTAFACSLIYGMPSDAVKLITDMTIGAVFFCIVPDKLLSKTFNGVFSAPSVAIKQYGSRLKFAASAVSDVKSSFEKAVQVFSRCGQEHDIASEVCTKVCSSCRNHVFCGENEEHRINSYLRYTVNKLEENGYISDKELHKALDVCPNKQALTETFNELYRLSLIEQRSENIIERMREITLEQLSSTEDILKSFGMCAERFPYCDERLSTHIREILEEYGAKNTSAAFFTDREGRAYIECFYEDILKTGCSELNERLSIICDHEFDEPELMELYPITRLCFHEATAFEAEIGCAAINGREETSGDSNISFSDGFGNLYILISDGMGSGVKAAVESRMTVSLMTRIIRSGLGIAAAVRMINLLLLTKSADESFATIDLMKINLFTGKSEIVKLGAAQSFLKTNGTVKTIESWSAPAGIIGSSEISKRNVQLSDGDEVVLITDGICEDCFPRIRELMLSIGITAQECAERIIGTAELSEKGNSCPQDDKTVCVVKINKV